MEDLSNIGYSTYYLGIPKNIQECQEIYLYMQSGTERDLITLYNIQNIVAQIQNGKWDTKGPKTIQSSRASKDDYFILEPTARGEVIEFDTIIYLGQSGQGVGYTSFSLPQSTQITNTDSVESLSIQLNFTVTPDNVVQVDILNSLSEIYSGVETDTSGLLTGSGITQDTLSLYPDTNVIRDHYSSHSDNYLRYTNLLHDLTSEMVLTTDTLSYWNGSAWSFGVAPEIVLDSWDSDYSNYSIGTWKSELALYEWSKERQFRILSLTRVNRFGVPTILKSGKIEGMETLEITGMAGNYALAKSESGQGYLYNLIDQEWIYPGSQGFLIDPWDETGKIVWWDSSINLGEDATGELQKMLEGTWFDPSSLGSTSRSLTLSKKIGEWLIFETTDYTGQTKLIWSGPCGTLEASETDFILPISSRCLLTQGISRKGWTWWFYFFDSGQKHQTGTYESDQDYIKVIPAISGTIREPLIDGLRHRPIQKNDLPGAALEGYGGIIATYRGILFYLESDSDGTVKLKYL